MYGGQAVEYNTNLRWIVMVLSQLSAEAGRICTGSMIGKKWVLTAAHCVSDKTGLRTLPVNQLKVRTYWSRLRTKDYMVEDVFVYPTFMTSNTSSRQDDVALVKLEVDIPDIIPQPMESDDKIYPQGLCMIGGYGKSSPQLETMVNPVLVIMDVPLLCKSGCSRLSPPDSQILCLAIWKGVGPCMGDSGSPMVCNGKLSGVLSRGFTPLAPPSSDPFCSPSSTALVVYERVAKFQSWIKDMIIKNEGSYRRPQVLLMFLPVLLFTRT